MTQDVEAQSGDSHRPTGTVEIACDHNDKI